MRNRYSLVYAWTVARIAVRSRSRGPESLCWRGFPPNVTKRATATSGAVSDRLDRLQLLDHEVRRTPLDDALDLEHLMLG